MTDTREYRPVAGKTYSLFGNEAYTRAFFSGISEFTDEILIRFSLSEKQLLDYIERVSRNKRKLRKSTGSNPVDPDLSFLVQAGHELLSPYMTGIEQHLKSSPSYKLITDKGLLTSREQYYLYMIGFELVNRIHRERFRRANYRIALMPYCLRETQTDCKARQDEIDFQCKACLKTCYVNRVSGLLRENSINPYIWRTAKLKPLFRELVGKHGSIGVFGIACVVELMQGMRLCMKAGVPVIGIPLNANRCIRWMDEFHETSVDLSAVKKLIAGDPYLD